MSTRSVEQATPQDLPEIRQLLLDVFQGSEDRIIFSRQMLAWKAFEPHPFWEGGRSYILRLEGRVVAHGLVVPLRLKTVNATYRAQCIIDWVANKEAVGGGVLLYSELRRLTDLQIGIGGSDQAQRVLPRMGFSKYRSVRLYSRVIRPAAHLVKVRGYGPGAWPRLGRDYKELFRGRVSGTDDVQAIPCKTFEAGKDPYPDPVIAAGSVFEHTAESLNYIMQCPVHMEAYRLQFRGNPWGYCVLSRIGNQCRVANMWVQSSRAEDWSKALSRITQLAAADRGCTEVQVCTSLPLLDSALIESGFRTPFDFPLWVYKPQMPVLQGGEVSVTFTENDGFYL